LPRELLDLRKESIGNLDLCFCHPKKVLLHHFDVEL
jgi:hypothetical protein